MFYCRLHGGLEPLVELIKDSENSSNKKLLAAVTGALWKVASDAENVERLIDLGIVPTLIRLLLDNSDALDDLQFNPLKIAVLTNVQSRFTSILLSGVPGSLRLAYHNRRCPCFYVVLEAQ